MKNDEVYRTQIWHELGIPYPWWALSLAKAGGWDGEAHFAAVLSTDEDAIGSTHPYLFLPEITGLDYDAAEEDGNKIHASWKESD